MRNFKASFWIIFVIAFALTSISSGAESNSSSIVERLNQIQDEAQGLNEFLNRPDLRDQFLLEAQRYFGGKDGFPKASFDAILDQLEVIAKSDPTIAARIWQKTAPGPTFSVHFTSNQNRNLDEDRWNSFITQTRNRIENRSGRWKSWWKSDETARQFSQSVMSAQTHIKKELESAGYSKTLFDSLMAQYEEEIAGLLLFQLELEDNKEGLQSQSWEAISFVTEKLAIQQNLDWNSFFNQSPELVKYWKYMEPELFRVSRFPERYCHISKGGNTRVITFRAVRPFLALFRGLYVKECTAGDCTLLDRLTPRRYAIPALNDSWVQFVEEEGKGLGHIQAVTLVNGDATRVLSTDFMAGVLKEHVHATISSDRPPIEVTVFDLWHTELQRRLSPGTLGVALSGSLNANNEKIPEFLHTKKKYLLGRDLGPASHFSPADADMAYRISVIGWRIEKKHYYGNCLTFDGCDEEDRRLRLLDPTLLESISLDDQKLQNLWSSAADKTEVLKVGSRSLQVELAKTHATEFKATLVANKLSEEAAEAYIRYLTENQKPDEKILDEIQKTKRKFLARGLGAIAKRTIGLLELPLDINQTPSNLRSDFNNLEDEQQIAVLKVHIQRMYDAGMLGTWAQIINETKRHKAALNNEAFENFGLALAPFLPKFQFDSNWFIALQRHFGFVGTHIQQIKYIAPTISDAKSFMNLISPDIDFPSDPYKSGLNELTLALTPQFLELNPTPKQIHEWFLKFSYVTDLIASRKKMLSSGKLTAQHIISVFTPERKKSSEFYNNAFKKFYADHWEAAFSAFESLSHYYEALEECPYIAVCIKIRAQALKLVRSPEAFLELYQPHRKKANDDDYKAALKRVMADQVDFYLSLNPSRSSLKFYQDTVKDPEVDRKVSEYLRSKSQGDRPPPKKNCWSWFL